MDRLSSGWRPPSERHRQIPRPADRPTIGFFLVRLVKDGPLVPAEIRCENGRFSAIINGELQGEPNADPFKARGVEHVYLGVKITRERHDALLRLKDDPTHPIANPRKPVVFTDLPPILP